MRRWCVAALALTMSVLTNITNAAVPDFAAVRATHRPSDVTLLDRHGQPIQTLRTDHQARRGAWLPLSDVSPALREALVLSEDRRFWQHSGVDWGALSASAWANAWNTRTRGASTLTMQLAGLLEPTLARPAAGRSVAQKLSQIALARELESRWSKAQILEAYLNLVPLRGELVGVPAASMQLLGKHPSGLDRLDAALLTALVRAPNAGEADVARRGCEILKAQARPCSGFQTLTAQALVRRAAPATAENIAPHFARYWLNAGGGPRTTIDATLQRLALHTLRQQLAELRGREVEDGAVLVLDNRSGEVRAWVGAAGASEVDAVLARRQPGSTLKPFVYAEALQRRLITPASLLMDEPLQLSAGRDAYQPQNFDHQWRGWVSAREALASSLNVPAVRVGAMLGPDALFDAMNRAGLRLRESAGFHGHALALGSAEVTLLDLANAYRALANGGVWRAPSLPSNRMASSTAGHRVFDSGVARAITAILSDPAARATGFGFDSPLVTRQAAAVKTGTSKDMRDNWCVGYTDTMTVAVWIGNVGGAPMHGVSGVIGAAPVWRRIVQSLPGSGARVQVEAAQPVHTPPRATTSAFAIGPLRDGSLLALDPDIPLARQRVRLHGPVGRWTANGVMLGQGADVWWSPSPGRHQLEVRDDQQRLLDRIGVEVRPGLPPRQRAVNLANG